MQVLKLSSLADELDAIDSRTMLKSSGYSGGHCLHTTKESVRSRKRYRTKKKKIIEQKLAAFKSISGKTLYILIPSKEL